LVPVPEVQPDPAPTWDEPAQDACAPLTTAGRALQALGLPAELCAKVLPITSLEALEVTLTLVLRAALPALPVLPRSRGSVVAVLGPPDAVLTTARSLARELSLPNEEVPLASRRKVWSQKLTLIGSPNDAAEQRRSWRWRTGPTVIAIEQPVAPNGAEWARALLESLEPALCYGVAEAFHKPEDLASWSDALGGLDALALLDLSATTTPAAALACPVPIARIDGELATADAWAEMLCGRLAAKLRSPANVPH
jgi:hypothetical protein